jgi:hypothetical protein
MKNKTYGKFLLKILIAGLALSYFVPVSFGNSKIDSNKQKINKNLDQKCDTIAKFSRKINIDNILSADKYIFKFNFAGSGDKYWRKVIDGKIPRQRQHSIKDDISNKVYGSVVSGTKGLVRYISKSKKEEGVETVTVEFTFSGPLSFLSIRDSRPGIEEIKNIAVKVFGILSKKIPEGKNIKMLFKGHSRGAVAMSKAIREIQSNYKDFIDKNKIFMESIAFDPVPGPFHKGDDCSIDNKNSGVVIYSLNPKKSPFNTVFSPQEQKNPKTLIVHELDHSCGLLAVEQTKDLKTKKKHYIYDNQYFSPGHLSDLPSGVYWAKKGNQSFILKKITINSFKTKWRKKLERLTAVNRFKFLERQINNMLVNMFDNKVKIK